MKLLFTATNSISTNGTTQRMLFIAKALAEIGGHRIAVAVPDFPSTRDFLKRYAPDVEGYFFPPDNCLGEIRAKLAISRVYAPHVILGFCVGLRFLLPRGRSLGSLIVYDWDELMSAHSKKAAFTQMKNVLVEAASLRTGHAWLTASEFLNYRIAEQRGARQVFYLPNGFDATIDARVSSSALPGGFQVSYRHLLYVGSVTREYQLWELIPLAELAAAEGLPWKIHIVGDGRDMAQFKRATSTCSAAEMFVMHGRVAVAEIPRYLAAADVLVFPFPPSVQNIARCPLKTYQYIASRKPIVTNQVGEVGKALGRAGIYYLSGDVQSLITACKTAVDTSFALGLESQLMESMKWNRRVEGLADWLQSRYVEQFGRLPAMGHMDNVMEV